MRVDRKHKRCDFTLMRPAVANLSLKNQPNAVTLLEKRKKQTTIGDATARVIVMPNIGSGVLESIFLIAMRSSLDFRND